ncbi:MULTISPECIES: tetratricopeptide repeat protein [unclassified Novosphingobium]|uniref:tetratricopeptide repeat protein n=1 Tax=unclassified Novosphingobium TaxID=2644732 RepID=UPI001447BE00|nr:MULTISPECIES: tetratricopeptide repeat protein [unclassified Novosphingobium]NKJ44987.1 tetratricopeptide (TPR) repeat protein [Novosphingobium sp. SG720]NMN07368.1 tetratricopeptide (TPR) repeat protein [Novosphingobium sp. SG919]NMN89727.1 tetratricopeptide (TPR) repeat protein [Novosphingobium sp. SG916]
MKYRTLWLATCGLGAILLFGCGADPKAAAQRAEREYAARDYTAAQADLAIALEATPDDPALLELHARNALALGNGEAAATSLDKLAKSGRAPADMTQLVAEADLQRGLPDRTLSGLARASDPASERLRALALLAKEDRPGATRAIASALAQAPNDPRALALAAQLDLQSGNLADARSKIDRALHSDGDLLEVMMADAQVATAQGDLARALAAYERAAQRYPGNVAALAGKAGIQGDLGRISDMKQTLAQLGNSRDRNVIYLRARLAADQKDWAGARDILQANEKTLEGLQEADVLYARVLVMLDQPAQATARLEPILMRNPQSAIVRRELASAQLAGNDARGALATLKPLSDAGKALQPEDARLIADAAKRAGDPQAAALAARARFPDPRALAGELATADAAMKARNWGQAIASYEHILASTNGNAMILNNLAYAQAQVGNSARALDLAKRAYALAPENPSIMDTLGWQLLRVPSERARGLQLLRDAAAKAPANPNIKAHLQAAESGKTG